MTEHASSGKKRAQWGRRAWAVTVLALLAGPVSVQAYMSNPFAKDEEARPKGPMAGLMLFEASEQEVEDTYFGEVVDAPDQGGQAEDAVSGHSPKEAATGDAAGPGPGRDAGGRTSE